jgi:hypothetical protein
MSVPVISRNPKDTGGKKSENTHMFFFGDPVKRGGESIFEGIFDFEKNLKKMGDERWERQNERTME